MRVCRGPNSKTWTWLIPDLQRKFAPVVIYDTNLEDARLNNVNLAHVSIDNAKISGLTILGWNIADLIKDARHEKLQA